MSTKRIIILIIAAAASVAGAVWCFRIYMSTHNAIVSSIFFAAIAINQLIVWGKHNIVMSSFIFMAIALGGAIVIGTWLGTERSVYEITFIVWLMSPFIGMYLMLVNCVENWEKFQSPFSVACLVIICVFFLVAAIIPNDIKQWSQGMSIAYISLLIISGFFAGGLIVAAKHRIRI